MGIGTGKRCADHSCPQPNSANPPGVDLVPSDASAPKGNRGAFGPPTVTLIRRCGFGPSLSIQNA